MSVRTRANRGARGRSHSGASFLRSLLLLTLLGCLSFVLGFFVIARVVPGISKQDSNSTPSSNVTGDVPPPQSSQSPPTVASEPRTSPSVSPFHSAPPANSPTMQAHSNAPGPSIDPMDDEGAAVQKPGSPDEPVAGDTRGHVTRANHETPSVTAMDTKTGAAAETIKARRKRRRAADNPHLQTPANPDDAGDGATTSAGSETPGAAASTDQASGGTAANPDSAASTASGSYRVQLGVFATRAKADEVAGQARSKGFDIYVKRYRSRSGKRLYRVQQGIYQDREHADEVRQQLQDSGLSASVNPN